jgi:hypothetical protein
MTISMMIGNLGSFSQSNQKKYTWGYWKGKIWKKERKKEHWGGAKEEGNALKKWIKATLEANLSMVFNLCILEVLSKPRTHLYN